MQYSSIHQKDGDLYTIQDLITWKPPLVTRIIDKGIFNVGNRMIIFGDEGSWKSMLTIHTAITLANGSKWFGFKTSVCNILKIQVELPMYSDRKRIMKYADAHERIVYRKSASKLIKPTQAELDKLAAQAHSTAYPYNIVNRTEHFMHFDESYGPASLKKNIDVCLTSMPSAPLVVILDPLYLLVGGNTNDETEMRRLLDNINIIIAEYEQKGFGLSFIVIHHSRKDKTDDKGQSINMGSQDASGTRAFAKWADTMVRLDLSDKNSRRVSMSFTKHRNAEEDLPEIELKWHRETLHPQVTKRYIKHDKDEEDETDINSEMDYTFLES